MLCLWQISNNLHRIELLGNDLSHPIFDEPMSHLEVVRPPTSLWLILLHDLISRLTAANLPVLPSGAMTIVVRSLCTNSPKQDCSRLSQYRKLPWITTTLILFFSNNSLALFIHTQWVDLGTILKTLDTKGNKEHVSIAHYQGWINSVQRQS